MIRPAWLLAPLLSLGCMFETAGRFDGPDDATTPPLDDAGAEIEVEPDAPVDVLPDAEDDAAPDVGDEGTVDDGAIDDGLPDEASSDGVDTLEAAEADDGALDDAGPEDAPPEETVRDDWLTGWGRRVSLTVDSRDVGLSLDEFPMLLHLSAAAGRGPDDVTFVFDALPLDAQRLKIAVTTDDGVTQCPVEIERWSATDRKAWLWVRAPRLLSYADTVFYLYYDAGQPDNVSFVGDTGSAAAQSVWNDSYRLVLHMQDDPSSAVLDSTRNGNDGVKGAPTDPDEVDGLIGRGLRWDGVGVNEFVQIPNAASLDVGPAFTAEVWVRYDGGTVPDDFERMLCRKSNWNDLNGWEFSLETAYDRNLTARGSSGAGTAGIVNLVTSWRAGGWRAITVVYDGSTASGYSDGAFRYDTGIAPVADNDRPLLIGRYGAAVQHKWFGLMDEVRLSDTIRSPAWILAGYESGRDHLLDFGAEEAP